MSKFTKPVLALFVILAMCVCTFAQSGTSRVTGTVQDRTGAVIPGAKVTLTNEGTQVAYTTTSTSSGAYTFDSVQSGSYSVSVEAGNFKKFLSTANVVSVGQPATVNAVMDVGAAGETVEVSGTAELVQTSSSGNFGTIVDSVSLAQLPIIGVRGRNAISLIAIVPGVIEGGAFRCNTGGCSSVNGSRDRAWNFTLDGVDTNETSAGGSQLSPARINPDSISEFRVITGQTTAEYGRNVGGQVTMVTKSGTNNFKGSAFWYYQTPSITANDPRNKAATPQLKRGQFVQNIYGGSLGGPIIKNKTFFFANVQLLHALNSSIVTRTVYTDTLKNSGIFRYATTPGTRNRNAGEVGASVDAAGNPIVPIASYNIGAADIARGGPGLDTMMATFLALAPSPNNFSVGDGLNTAGFTFLTPQLEKQVDVVVKVDHNFNPNNSIFVRYAGGHQNTEGDTANAGQPRFPGLPNSVNTLRRPRNVAFNWRWNPTTKSTNELIIGLNRFAFDFFNPVQEFDSAPPFVTNLVTDPLRTVRDNSRFLTTYQLADNFTRVAGSHTFKGGVNLRYARHIDHRFSIGSLNAYPQVTFSTAANPVNRNAAAVGGYGISALTTLDTTNDRGRLESAINDLLGRIGQISVGYVAKDDSTFNPIRSANIMDHRWAEYDFYFQDSWKIRPNLTVDLGLRLEARMSPELKNFPNLVPDQPIAFGSPATSTLKWVPGDFFKDDWNNFGPSIGVAWAPYGDGKTAFRANYRLAYDRINTFSFSSSVLQGMPGLTFQMIDTTSGPAGLRAKNWVAPVPPSTPLALRQLPASGVGSITVADPNMRTPKVNMFGFSFEQQIMKNTVFSLTYNGRHGVGLYGAYNSNQADIRGNAFLTEFIKIKADPTYQSALFNQIFSADTRRGAQTGTTWARSAAGFATSFNQNNVAGLAQTISNTICTSSTCTAGNSGVPLLTASGMPLSFFQPFTQVRGGLLVLDTNDYSTYHGLTTEIQRRFTNGLQLQFSHTWSKSLDVRSFDPAFTIASTTGGSAQSSASTPFDKSNPRLNYAPSDLDRTHVFQSNWYYELPFGQKKRWANGAPRVVDLIIGGWSLAGTATYQTGRPATVYSGSSTMSSVDQTPASCTGPCDPYYGEVFRDGAAGNHQFFFPTVGAFNNTTNCRALADGSQLCIPGPGEFSNIGRNYFRQPIYANLDLSIGKDFRIIEGHNLQARLQMQNVTNSQMYDSASSFSIQSGTFWRLKQDTDGARGNEMRRMQLALKYTF